MNKNFKKLTTTNCNISKFNDFGAYIVDNQCTNMDKSPITGEARDILIWDKAYDMALGIKAVKNEYLITGTLIGIGVSLCAYGTYKTINYIKNRKKKES